MRGHHPLRMNDLERTAPPGLNKGARDPRLRRLGVSERGGPFLHTPVTPVARLGRGGAHALTTSNRSPSSVKVLVGAHDRAPGTPPDFMELARSFKRATRRRSTRAFLWPCARDQPMRLYRPYIQGRTGHSHHGPCDRVIRRREPVENRLPVSGCCVFRSVRTSEPGGLRRTPPSPQRTPARGRSAGPLAYRRRGS